MPQQAYTLRKIWPNIPDKIVQCTADLYRIYSCRRFLFSEKSLDLTKIETSDGLANTDADQQPYEQPEVGGALETIVEQSRPGTVQTVHQEEIGHHEENKQLGQRLSLQMPMPTFVLSSASPEPHEIQLRSDSVVSVRFSPPMQGDTNLSDAQRKYSVVYQSPAQSRRTSSLKTSELLATRMSDLQSPTDITHMRRTSTLPHTGTMSSSGSSAPEGENKPAEAATPFSRLTGMVMELDDLTLHEKCTVLTLLIKSRLYERIVVKALCKAKLFEEFVETTVSENTDLAMTHHSNKPPVDRPPVRAPVGAPYKDYDFYMFSILALYYFESGFVVRPQTAEEEKFEAVQIARTYIKDARIQISASFAKLHIAAQVPVIAQMLTAEEQTKLYIEQTATKGPREGLVYLFLPDEYTDAQLLLCDQLGADFLRDHQISKNAALVAAEEAAAAHKANVVSVFSRPHEQEARPVGSSFLPREKNFRFGLTIPADCISREIMLERVHIDYSPPQHPPPPQIVVNKTNTDPAMGQIVEEPEEEKHHETTQQQPVQPGLPGKERTQPTLVSEKTEPTLSSTVRISYRCQDRFSAFALYAASTFLPTSHPGQTAAVPIVPVPGGGDNEFAHVPVCLVVTGLTSPNQLSGLVRLLHYLRLWGPLSLGPLESVFIFGLGLLGKAAHARLAAISAEPATKDAIKNLELINEDFTTAVVEDEKFKNVKVALVFGDIATDIEFGDDGYSNVYLDQPISHAHPVTKANTGSIIDAVVFAAESSHYVWYSATPSLVIAKPKKEKTDREGNKSPVVSESGRSRRSSIMPPGSSDEDEGERSDDSSRPHSDHKHAGKGGAGNKGGKGGKGGEQENKRAGKGSLHAPTLGKGKRTLQMPMERESKSDHGRRMSNMSNISNPTSNKLTSRLRLDAKIMESRSSLVSQGSSRRSSTNVSPAPPNFALTLKPNSKAFNLYQATIHAAKLPQVQTIVLAIRNVPNSNYGEMFLQSVMQEINEINIVAASAPKATVTEPAANVDQPLTIQVPTIGTTLVPPSGPSIVVTSASPGPNTGDSGNNNAAPGDQTAPVVEPPRPTHRITSQLHLVPIPLTVAEIMAVASGGKETVVAGGPEKTMLTSVGATGLLGPSTTGLSLLTAPSAVPASSTGAGDQSGNAVTGIFFDGNGTPDGANSFVFGGFIASMSITRTLVSQKQAGGRFRRPPQNPSANRQVSAHTNTQPHK